MSVRSLINSVRLGVNPVAALARRVPGRAWFALACFLAFALWLHDHNAHIRQKAALDAARSQAAATVAGLKKQAAADVQAANARSAQAMQQLKAEHSAIERRDQELAARLESLQRAQQVQTEQVATLPTSEVVTRVATQLGLKAEDLASAQGNGNARVVAVNSPVDLTVGLPSQEKPTVQKAPTAAGTASRKDAKPQSRAAKAGSEGADTTAVVLGLSDSGARKVETVLINLNACQAESSVKDQQVAACRERAAADEKTIQQQADSIAQLNQALHAKDRILAEQQTEYKAEVRAARGSFFSRLLHASEHVALGVAVGVAIGVAAR